MTYKLNMSHDEIDQHWQDLKKERKDLNTKNMELVVLEALKFLREDCLNCIIDIELSHENSYYFSISIIPETEEIEEELNEKSEFLRFILEQIPQEIIENEGSRWSFEFINTEEGRGNFIKKFIGNDWQTWINNLKVTERYDDLSKNLNENTNNKNKIKL